MLVFEQKKGHQSTIREYETAVVKKERLGAVVTWRRGMFQSRSRKACSKLCGTMCYSLIRFHTVTFIPSQSYRHNPQNENHY
jgi:hypothetical protein